MVWVWDHVGISENSSFVSEMPREIDTQSNIKLASRRYLGGPQGLGFMVVEQEMDFQFLRPCLTMKYNRY